VYFCVVTSPTHKRTKGRALVWGSEFTSKAAALQGDSAEIAPTLNVKLWVLVTGDWWWWHEPLFWNSRAHGNSKFW
jgi:hypothetical protein